MSPPRSQTASRALTRTPGVLLCLLLAACGSKSLKVLPDSGGHQGGGGMFDVARSSGGHSQGGTTGQGQGGMTGQDSTSTRPQCRESADCTQTPYLDCIPPGGSLGCGVCFGDPIPPCTSDSECQTDGRVMICDVADPCCSLDAKGCIPGCMDGAGCSAGEACVAHRCVPISCQSDADCPPDFGCTGGRCLRKNCSTDVTCSGACVNGSCYSAPGTCEMLNV